MSVALVMRSPKFRILLYILGIGITCLTVLLLHNEHSHLKEVQRSYSICQQEKEICIQEKDSTSAQLQVLYEQKKRIETSLQQERTDHQKAKEGMEKKSIETQAAHSQLETEMNELHSKYSQLLNDYKLLKETNNQMENQLGELKESYALLEEEKKNLNIEVSSQLQALHQQREEEVNKLHDQLKKISGEKEQLLHDNAQQEWRLKQHDSKIRSCEKQHHQLMIQFDEVALQLNNCMKGINITKSENFHSQKSSNENRQNSITPKVDFGLHDHDTKEKSVHIPDTKVRNELSPISDFNNHHIFINPSHSHYNGNDLNKHHDEILAIQDFNKIPLHDHHFFNMYYPQHQESKNNIPNSINNFHNILKNRYAYPYPIAHPVPLNYNKKGQIHNETNQQKSTFDHNPVIRGHVIEKK